MMATGELQFHVLSFEGPDAYARAGGIASRVTGLIEALVAQAFPTHLWFVGDPERVGNESREQLHLHRWCQWISRAHPDGVYAGEHVKHDDYARSLPPWLVDRYLEHHLRSGGRAVILAEEWHTVHAVLHLDWLLRVRGLRDRVTILWNANNTFGFEAIEWPRLAAAAVITTVSRYMRHLLAQLGVAAVVIPNGLGPDAFAGADRDATAAFARRFSDRPVLTKIARWDPDKAWIPTIEIVAALKQRGQRPLLIARGGLEAYGHEVLAAAHAAGLRVVDRWATGPGIPGLLAALDGVGDHDMVNIRTPIGADERNVLLRASSAVLANSRHEPFGLVGLETMAAGGLACTGCSGEDYAVDGRNAIVLQTAAPGEFVGWFERLRRHPEERAALRREGQATARLYAWDRVLARNLLPQIYLERRA